MDVTLPLSEEEFKQLEEALRNRKPGQLLGFNETKDGFKFATLDSNDNIQINR